MAIPSLIVGAKQSKELSKKNEFVNKSSDEIACSEEEQLNLLDENKSNDCEQENINNTQLNENQSKAQTGSLNKNKLLELKELFDAGLITDEEYNTIRKQILENFIIS